MKTLFKTHNTANIVVGAVLIAVVATSFIIAHLLTAQANGETYNAKVHDASGAVYEIPLDEETHITIETEYGYNTIAVEDGSVFVSDADCENKYCMKQGKISKPGQQIICLPHKLFIEIVPANNSHKEGTTAPGSKTDENDSLSAAPDAVSR